MPSASELNLLGVVKGLLHPLYAARPLIGFLPATCNEGVLCSVFGLHKAMIVERPAVRVRPSNLFTNASHALQSSLVSRRSSTDLMQDRGVLYLSVFR